MKRMQDIDFRQAYGDVPPAFANRVNTTLRSLNENEKESRIMKKPITAFALILALLAMTTVAIAATLSHTADFFGVEYGPEFQQKLEEGTVAPGGQSTTLNAVTFTLLDAVVVEEETTWLADQGALDTPVKSLGFYATGVIAPVAGENIALLAADCEIAAVPPADATIRWVTCIPNGMLDANGELLQNTVGMELVPQADGTVLFSVEIPPEHVIAVQDSYQLSLYIATKEVDAQGNPIDDTRQSMDWVVTLTPEKAQ